MTIVSGLDLETTGLEWENGHKIIEFACIPYELETGKRLTPTVLRINPERPIELSAQRVHGISFEDVSMCPTFYDYRKKIFEAIDKSDIIVAHNGNSFDFPFLKYEMEKVGLPVPAFHTVDTMVQGRWATPMGKSPSLKELCFACDVPYDPEKAHGAEYDVDVMMQSFFVGYKLGFFKVNE